MRRRGDAARGIDRGLPILAALVALAGVAGLAGRWITPLDAFSHLALVYLVAAAALAAHTPLAAPRARFTALALLALGAGASLALIVPEYLQKRPETAEPGPVPSQIKIIQLNALRTNGDIARVARWVISERPDIVTITEARHDLRDRLIRQAGWKLAGEMGHLMIFTPRHYLVMNRPKVDRRSQLTFVNATYEEAVGNVEVVTAHIGWPIDPDAPRQIRGLEDVVRRLPRDRMVLTGDFNAAGWSQAIRGIDARYGLVRRDHAIPTWPAQILGRPWPLPFVPIDHVYAGPGWRTVSVRRGPWVGSDHYPLVVVLAPSDR